LDATLVKGSHGRVNIADEYKAVLITNGIEQEVQPTDVFNIILRSLNRK
jgi:hypothetical protein